MSRPRRFHTHCGITVEPAGTKGYWCPRCEEHYLPGETTLIPARRSASAEKKARVSHNRQAWKNAAPEHGYSTIYGARRWYGEA